MTARMRIAASLVTGVCLVCSTSVAAQRGNDPADGEHQVDAAASGRQRGAAPLGGVAALGVRIRI